MTEPFESAINRRCLRTQPRMSSISSIRPRQRSPGENIMYLLLGMIFDFGRVSVISDRAVKFAHMLLLNGYSNPLVHAQ